MARPTYPHDSRREFPLPRDHSPKPCRVVQGNDLPPTIKSSFLEVLPREIRYHIYSLILAPTGRFTLRRPDYPTDNPSPILYPSQWPYAIINLSLTETCRQICHECRGIFWERNTLVLTQDLLKMFDTGGHLMPFWPELRKIELQFSFNMDGLGLLQKIVPKLETLAKGGSLQQVALVICGLGTMTNFGHGLDGFMVPEIISSLNLLNKVKKGDLGLVTKSFDLKLASEHASPSSRAEWFQKHPHQRCEETMKTIHKVIDGDVMVDGILCYRNNVRLHERFKELAEAAAEEQFSEEFSTVGF